MARTAQAHAFVAIIRATVPVVATLERVLPSHRYKRDGGARIAAAIEQLGGRPYAS